MACVWCHGPLEFVDGGEWAGFNCPDRKCPGWEDQAGDFVASDGIRRIAPPKIDSGSSAR